MRRLSVFTIICICLSFFSAPLAFGAQRDVIAIESISHKKESATKEVLLFKFSGPVPFHIFTLKGERPRLVLDFTGAEYHGEKSIDLPDGELALSVRTGVHRKPVLKTRVVVDLPTTTPVQYKHDFDEKKHLLKIILSGPQVGTIAGKPKPLKQAGEAIGEPEKQPVVDPKKADSTISDIANILPSPELERITFDDSSNKGEMVKFYLNDFHPPSVTALEKERPRVFCDFIDASLAPGVDTNLVAGGKFVESIRTALHNDPRKVRVVLDLAPDKDYDLQQVFFKNDNIFVLIVNEVDREKAKE